MTANLDVDVAVHPCHTLVRIAGDLDMDTCPHLAEVTDALILGGRILIVDLSHVPFMDCSALRSLLALDRRAHAEQAVLKLRGMSRQGLCLLNATGTRRYFGLRRYAG
ncbi:STAS domain-containing protein [Streptomyces sp. NPDC004311]|uniref:STAS domain-containing protein n=1 Tax=Streptomyces sp. NPDC004311 TaxID=3364698 RepID=UPI003680F45B